MTTDLPSYAAIQRHSPTRSLSWRWDRAEDIVWDDCSTSRRQDDKLTRQAVRYLRAKKRLKRQGQLRRLAQLYPDIHAARQFHEGGGKKVVEVQARLLAGQSPAEIAGITSLPVSLIKTYEALFFHVTDRLHARDWITAKAIGWFGFDPTRGRNRGTVLRAFAYHAGLLVLEAVLPYLLPDTLPAEPTLDPASPEGRLDRCIRLAIELHMLPWTDAAALKLFRIHSGTIAEAQQPPLADASGTRLPHDLIQMLDELASGTLRQLARQPVTAVPEAVQPNLAQTG
jgi:hypothetical protein